MKNALFSLVAIGVASIAAIAATSTFLNMPHRIGPETTTQAPPAQPAPAPDSKPATGGDAKPTTPAGSAGTSAPPTAPATAGGATDTKPAEEEADKDPYEGIAPEELPPDLQYNADSSVSFPTNI